MEFLLFLGILQEELVLPAENLTLGSTRVYEISVIIKPTIYNTAPKAVYVFILYIYIHIQSIYILIHTHGPEPNNTHTYSGINAAPQWGRVQGAVGE